MSEASAPAVVRSRRCSGAPSSAGAGAALGSGGARSDEDIEVQRDWRRKGNRCD
jgi:hypothetical protein